jgi:hypothetical protein
VDVQYETYVSHFSEQVAGFTLPKWTESGLIVKAGVTVQIEAYLVALEECRYTTRSVKLELGF